MTYTTTLEYAHVVKTLVITSCTLPESNKTDRGNKAILERFIYINIVRELTQVILHYGLFPSLSDSADHEPHLKLAYDYMCNEKEDSAHKFKQFKQLLFNMGVTNINNHPNKLKCVTNELSRSIKADQTFNPKICKQSLLPILLLQVIYCLKSTCIESDVANNPDKKKLKLPPGQNLLIAGSYEGTPEGNNKKPFDTTFFSINGKTRKVGKIGSLRLLGLGSNQSKNANAKSLRLITLATICFDAGTNLGKTRSSTLIKNQLTWWKKEIQRDPNRTLLEIEEVEPVSSSKPDVSAKTKQSLPPDNSIKDDENDSDKASQSVKQRTTSKGTKKRKQQDDENKSDSTPVTKKKKTLTEHIPMIQSVINLLRFVEDNSAFEERDKMKWNTVVNNFATASLGSVIQVKNTPDISCSNILSHCESYLKRLNDEKSSKTSQLNEISLLEKKEVYTYQDIIDNLTTLKRNFPMAKIDVLPAKKVTNVLVSTNTAYASVSDRTAPNINDPDSNVKKKFIAFKVNDIPMLKEVMYSEDATIGKPWMRALTNEMKKWTSSDNTWKISLSLMGSVTREITHVIVLDEKAYNQCFPMDETNEESLADGEEIDDDF